MRSASVVEEGDENEPWWVPRDEDSNVITVEESVAEAVHALESETQLALDLGYRRLGAAGLARFSKQLNLNKSLTRIDLSCNLLQDSGAVIFFGAIAKLTAVQKVNLAGNMIGPPGAKALAECLMVNKTLEKLSLFHNEIGNAGAVAVAEALTVNRTLHSLNLRENKITNQGVSALVKSVEKDVNPTLMVLCLRNNVAHPGPGRTGAQGKLSLLSQGEGLFLQQDLSADQLQTHALVGREGPLGSMQKADE
eukprot:gene21611-33253_t